MKTSWAFNGICQLWEKTTGEYSRVYVLDSGCPNNKHLSLQINNIFDTPQDSNGHATHICGIIHQIAPNCEIVPIKTTYLTPDIDLIIDALKLIIRNAKKDRYDIVNMSLSYSTYNKTIHKLIKKLYNMNIPVVCASGNRSGAVPWFPAKLDETISVASHGSTLAISKFSSIDKSTDFYAPGENINSTWLCDGNISMSGTSQAAPYVAGVLALLLSLNRRKLNMPTIINHLSKNGVKIENGMVAINPQKTINNSVIIIDSIVNPWYSSFINLFKKEETNESTSDI